MFIHVRDTALFQISHGGDWLNYYEEFWMDYYVPGMYNSETENIDNIKISG
jgi:hypothetical protein